VLTADLSPLQLCGIGSDHPHTYRRRNGRN